MSHRVTRDIMVAVPPDRLFDIIAQYERYPSFVPGVKACRVLSRGPGHADVELTVDVGVKTIRYSLRHLEQRPTSVTWSLLEGEWMKVSNGSWQLSPEGPGTRARYTVEVQVVKPRLIPQRLVDTVSDEMTRIHLPRTLAAFKHAAEGAHGT